MTKHIEIDADQYPLQRDELDELRRRVKELEWVVGVVEPPRCRDLHHTRKDQHEYDKPCPVEARVLAIINREAKS